jgi:type IV secretory pathway TrbF-like protein
VFLPGSTRRRKLGPLAPEEARKELRAWRLLLLRSALVIVAVVAVAVWQYHSAVVIAYAVLGASSASTATAAM